MIISQELRKSNIAEYLLYMFYIEDMLRALSFKEEMINNHIIRTYSKEQTQDAVLWYNGLCDMMKNENVINKGHIHIISNLITESESFLKKALDYDDEELKNSYSAILPVFREIQSRNNNELPNIGIFEMTINIMYWYMAQKMAGHQLNELQSEQIKNISVFLSVLSTRFKSFENGEYEL